MGSDYSIFTKSKCARVEMSFCIQLYSKHVKVYRYIWSEPCLVEQLWVLLVIIINELRALICKLIYQLTIFFFKVAVKADFIEF